MEKRIKINNVLFENVLFSKNSGNKIYTNNFKEEFFGIYNVSICGKNMVCESTSKNIVSCDIVFEGKSYKNIPFQIIDSVENKIVIDKNSLNGNFSIIKENTINPFIEIEKGLNEKIQSKNNLKYLLEKSESEKEVFLEEVQDIKEKIKRMESEKEVFLEKNQKNILEDYKKNLLVEFFKISEESKNFIENKISFIKENLENDVKEIIQNFVAESLDFFKKENENKLRDAINEFYQEISESTRNEKEEFKNILLNESSIIEEKYHAKVQEQINLYSKINKELFESVNSAKKETETVLKEQIQESKLKLLESFEIAIQKQKKDFEEHSKTNKKLFEDVVNTKKKMEKNLNESIDISKKELLESLKKYKEDFSNSFASKFEKIINRKKEELKKETENILEQHDNGFLYFTEEKKKEIENISSSIITEANKKIKDLEKKVENLSSQLNKSNSEKKKIENLLQESRTYTDRKVNQMLEESKRFTRIMMDMVGGGSGSVAVQYADGGKINGDLTVSGDLNSGSITFSGASIEGDLNIGGDLNVGGAFSSNTLTFSGLEIEGDLDVGGTINATTILSGGVNLTEIFAGEGEGDTNILDGGTA